MDNSLIGSGSLSHTFYNNNVLTVPGQTPFELYEVEALIEEEERTIIIGVGEYDCDAWDAVNLEDENVYFWVSKDRFSQIADSIGKLVELDDANVITKINWETKTVFS